MVKLACCCCYTVTVTVSHFKSSVMLSAAAPMTVTLSDPKGLCAAHCPSRVENGTQEPQQRKASVSMLA